VGVCDVPVISTVCNSVGQGAGSLVAAPFDYLAQAIGQAAQWMFQGVWDIFDSTTAVDITSPGYVAVYNILFGVAVFITLIFFCLQLITGLIRRDPRSLSRAAFGMGKAILGSFLAITLTAATLQIVDQLCIGIVQATGTTMDQMGTRIGTLALGLTAINISTPGVGAIVTIFLAGLAISAAAIVWFSLLIRKALLLVAIVMAPIALAGSAWEATKGWFGKWAGFVLALAVSKLVIVVVFLVATAQLDAPINFDLASISQPIAGVVLMFIAAFAPYMAYRFISFMGFDTYHAMSSEQDAKSSMNRPIPIPNKPPTDSAKKVLDGRGSDTAGQGAGSNAPPVPGGGMAPAGSETGAATAGTAGGASGAGAGAAGAGAGAAGAGAAAGPIGIAAVVGAKAVGAAATAGPKLGGVVGQATEQHAAQSAATDTQHPAGATPHSTPAPAPVSTPAPPATPTQASKSAPQPSSAPRQ
jgi:hypothetical protein